jgi:hypothetical protein
MMMVMPSNHSSIDSLPVAKAYVRGTVSLIPVEKSKKPHLSDSLLQVMGQLIWARLATKNNKIKLPSDVLCPYVGR